MHAHCAIVHCTCIQKVVAIAILHVTHVPDQASRGHAQLTAAIHLSHPTLLPGSSSSVSGQYSTPWPLCLELRVSEDGDADLEGKERVVLHEAGRAHHIGHEHERQAKDAPERA